jgi:hypothetical protein
MLTDAYAYKPKKLMFRAVFWVVLPCKLIVGRQSIYTAVQTRRQL